MVLVCLLWSAGLVAAEYRTWTDEKGNVVEAEYRGIKNGKVVLVVRDGKEAEVDPALLSDEDREYIYMQERDKDRSAVTEVGSETNRSVDSVREPARITGGDANAIAKKYAEAISERDFDTWQSLMLDPGNWSSGAFKHKLDNELRVQQVRLKGNHLEDYGYSVRIQVVVLLQVFDGYGPTGRWDEHEWSIWLQILPDGKIKYDDLYIDHPMKIAMDWCWTHFLDEMKIPYWGRRRSDGELERTKVPDFGVTARHADHFAKMEALKNMREWLLDEGRAHDATEPIVSCPDEIFKGWRRNLKSF